METFPHLKIDREQPINEKRPGSWPRVKPPADIPAHARKLQRSLELAREEVKTDIGGFDDRPLFKLNIGSLSPDQIEKGFPGIEFISQEDGGYALVFASNEALGTFEARLTSLVEGEKPKYANLLYALEAFDHWTPEDRKGWALKRDGISATEEFLLDVELWPLGRSDKRELLIPAFEGWLAQAGIETLDKIIFPELIAYRLRLNLEQSEKVLNHRDVRTVDLPPKLGLELEVLRLDIQDVPSISPPPDDAPLLTILDSGIAGNHPLIGPALGDAQGFLSPGRDAHDDAGHGTHVSGIALYGDVEECAQAKSFIPLIRLLSGRVLDARAEVDPRFIENIVEESVRYFFERYNCRVYNLSYGDLNKPYTGGRVRGLASTLDRLAREMDILFVVPTGNIMDISFEQLANDYPNYFHQEDYRLIDPAPALNVLTVGSVARWDQGLKAKRWASDLIQLPVAARDQPSPFTRCGGSVKGAVKPELVAYGGNLGIDPRTKMISNQGLGELSTSHDFAAGKLVTERSGTSFSAPHVAHIAARLLKELTPPPSMNLLRALLVSNAKVPVACSELFDKDEDLLERVVGYGMVDQSGIFRSTEEQVILVTESKLVNKHNHFYEVPVPDCLYKSGKRIRRREITVALGHCPPIRTTRIDYKASRFMFRLVEADSLANAVEAFGKPAQDEEAMDSIRELGCNKIHYSATKRSYGTVQASTWVMKAPRKKKLYLVVTRNDPAWGDALTNTEEKYAAVIRISDRENEEARLYTEIRAQLQARERLRQRVGV